jgi:hypothetical protein
MGVHPLDDVAGLAETLDLDQVQPGAVPIQRGQAARLVVPPEINSQEAQITSF